MNHPSLLLAFVIALLRSPLRGSSRLSWPAAAVCLALSFATPLHAAPLSGTRSIGPTGDYVSLTGAIAYVQAVGNGLNGPLVLELQASYVSTAETYPLTIPTLNGASAVNTLTIRPASGAAGLTISSANTTAATVNLNGAQFVTFDGRPGGVGSHAGSGGGTVSQLTIENTSTSGVALRFINEASSNTIQYIKFRGVNTSTTSGTVVFSTTTGANGNDNNTIDHCDLGDGASTPATCLYASGSIATPDQFNSGNIVSNCNVFNFYGLDATGLRLFQATTDWTISGNSFYQTASRAGLSGTSVTRPIYVVTSGSVTLSGNYIGGSEPNAGGAPWTITGLTSVNVFTGIRLYVGTTTPTSLQGNTISNLVCTSSDNSSDAPGIWSGIYVDEGLVDIGTTTGNVIGNGSGTSSVTITAAGTLSNICGIASRSSGRVGIANNTIGAITGNGSTTAHPVSIRGIQVTAGTNTITNNLIGSTTTANSINAASFFTSGFGSSGHMVTGIYNTSSSSSIIAGNMVANLNNNASGIYGQILGIHATDGVNTISGNTVRDLSTTSQSASTSVWGIALSSTKEGQTVSQNVVHSLINTAGSAAVSVVGIQYGGPAMGTNIIARNFVHSLAVSSSSDSSVLNGMQLQGGMFKVQNNMVRLGIKADGTSTAGASIVRGIFDNGSTSGRNYYHNSIYIGGSQTSGIANTFAFDGITGVSNIRSYQNNIFVNARGNSGGTGKHYAAQYGGSASTTGLTAGGNIFFASGVGGWLGASVGNHSTIVSWRTANGQDATSVAANPLFINPTGTALTLNLHLQAGNPAEGGALPVMGVTDDFDGQSRAALTPADIGADAGNFTSSSGDIFPPAISYPRLTNGSTTNRQLDAWVTCQDNNGTISGGANAPRLYFKKSTDANVFGVANNSTGNGWKYVTATGAGPYSFTLNYSIIRGGSVAVGDTIQYFVVAQDAANNLSSSPAGATASTNPPVQNVNGRGAFNSFTIVPTIGSTITVGAGGSYPSLTGAGGLFAALNAGVLNGNTIISITSDLTETGGVTLNERASNNYPPFTLSIQPGSATMRTISGTVASGLITLNGADGVTIDGRHGGGGRYLTFRNISTATAASTILLQNDSSSNTVSYCSVEGASANGVLGVIGFGTGTLTGNDDNFITNCQVRNLSTAAGVPAILIGSTGSSGIVANSGNSISDNELFNFNNYGIYITSTGNEMWTLSRNNIYEVSAATSSPIGIYMQGGGINLIAENFISNLLTTSSASVGISFGGTGFATISRNHITAFSVNAATTNVTGIVANGSAGSTLNVINNQITLRPATSISASLRGIFDGSIQAVINVYYNTIVLGGVESGTRSSYGSLRFTGTTHTARNNIFFNLRTGGTGSHFAAGSVVSGGSYTASNNIYAGTGATPESFMDFSTTGGTVPVSFELWQSSTGDTASQAGLAGSGNFTTAMFTNAATGDLHLVPGGNALVNALGIAIAGVTDDYDSDPRHATTPTIGSDEFVALTPYQQWAIANNVSTDPGALGGANLQAFAFGTAPGSSGALVYTGAFAGGGTITATGMPVIAFDPVNGSEFRALYVRRKDHAAAGLAYTPRFSANLTSWVDSAAPPVVLADDGVNQIIGVPFPGLISGQEARFFRVTVTLTP